jgi:hypothetical protein
MSEPGLDLHEWESRWASIAEVREDDPDAAVSLLADIVEGMLLEAGYDVREPEVGRTYQAAREVAERAELGGASRADVEDAIANLDEVFATLVAERPGN